MFLSTRDVAQMDGSALKAFIANKIPEGLYLDYKEQLSGKSDKEAKIEFLKDLTAFANAHGGNLILGVKEPQENLVADQQIVGLEQGESIAKDLERLASTSIDPRISGLIIRDIPQGNDRSCIVVHVPPSLGRPHMVIYQNHRGFYIRHSESSFPMSTHEIRESVILSLSAEDRARELLARREHDIVRYFKNKSEPLLLLQAAPLITPSEQWDMYNESLVEIMRGVKRRNKYDSNFDLCSNVAPKHTIDGRIGRDQREDTTWITEIHRNGYVSAAVRNNHVQKINNVNRYVVHSGFCCLFRAFGALLDELWEVTESDLPYIISSKYLDAAGTVMLTEKRWEKFSEPYEKDGIAWPLHYRNPGESSSEIAKEICLQMYNAFGFGSIVE